jgi:RND family efflux transporter MFP subunit
MMRWSNTAGALLGLALCLGGALSGCGRESETVKLGQGVEARSSSGAGPRLPLAVEVFEVKPAAARAQLIPAVISVEGTAVVLARREGIINWLGGQEGARVTKGEVIAQLDDDESRAQLHQAELEVSRMQAEERQYEALVKVNQSELARQVALARDGLASQTDIDRAQYKFDVSREELGKTRLATQMAEAKVAAVKIELEKTNIRAPLAGLITHRHTRLGSSVVRGEKLFEVAQLAPLEVRFQIPQRDQRRLAPGSLLQLSLVETGRAIAQARVRRVDPVVDAASNTLGYLADVIGGAGLLPGAAVYVRLPAAASNADLWVPRAAFAAAAELRVGAAATLLVLEAAHCAPRTVRIGAVEGDQVAITEGLNLGDRVILAPPAELKPGDPVESR